MEPGPTGGSKPQAIVIDLDGMTGLQTARILARHGVPVTGIASDPRHPCARTNVCEQVLITDTSSEALIEKTRTKALQSGWPVRSGCSAHSKHRIR